MSSHALNSTLSLWHHEGTGIDTNHPHLRIGGVRRSHVGPDWDVYMIELMLTVCMYSSSHDF